MRNLLALFALGLLTVAGVGWYLGWYSVQSNSAAAGKRTVNIDIDSNKISQDLQKGTEKVQQFLKEDGTQSAEKTKLDASKPVPKL